MIAVLGFAFSRESLAKEEHTPARDSTGLTNVDYMIIVKNYAEFMIDKGRDTYGKQKTPLFVSVMDRKKGVVFSNMNQVPYPHVKTKPWAPGLRRDHKMRPQDRHYTGANLLEDLPLYRLLYRLTTVTGDKRYAREADSAIKWFLDNAASPRTGLYPWGSHLHWNVHQDKAVYNTGHYGGHEYNYVWPYWDQNPEQLRTFAHGLWNNQITDKKSGRFSRHSPFDRRNRKTGYEFPQTASCYMDIWAREFGHSGDPEMKRALTTLLTLYRSMRHPKTKAMSWCTAKGADRVEVSCVHMNLFMATTLQDAAAFVEKRDRELAAEMRRFALQIDDEYLSHDYDKILDVAGKGILTWYTIADGALMSKSIIPPPANVKDPSIGFPLKRSDGGPAASLSHLVPWFVNRSYAGAALLLCDRYQRCANKHKTLYRRAVLETANIYMTIEPEVQFVLYPDDIASVVKLLRNSYGLTKNPAYLRRADHMMRIGVKLFFDDVSPLPKLSNFDDWYESSLKNGSSQEVLCQMVELTQDLKKLSPANRTTPEITLQKEMDFTPAGSAGEYPLAEFVADLKAALTKNMGGVWDGSGLKKESKDVTLAYGSGSAKRTLYLSQEKGAFAANRQTSAAFDISISDVVNKLPSTAEADAANNGRMTKFTGKSMAESDITYAGFKDVLINCGLLIQNDSGKAQKVVVAATFHDTYHDNGTVTIEGTVPARGTMFFGVGAPSNKYIRKLWVQSRNGSPVSIEKIGFVMKKRNALLREHSTQPGAEGDAVNRAP